MFLDDIGGKAVIQRVHKIFYKKVFSHPWLGKFFESIDQSVQETQQTDFMVQSFGGPENYVGKLVGPAHKHMYITDELFDLRQKLLEESLIEAGVCLEHRQKWLKIDGAFRGAVVKSRIEDCQKRFFTDEIMMFENPEKKKVA